MRAMSGALLGVVGAAACNDGEYNIQTLPPPSGELTVSGRACDPQTLTWLDGALVYTHIYDSRDVVWDSRSDLTGSDGAWALVDLAPRLDYEVYVQVGQEIVERFVVQVGDEDVVVPPLPCTNAAERDAAVVTDAFEGLAPLMSAVGAGQAQVIDGQSDEVVTFLTDAGAMHGYDLLVLDGGHREDGLLYGVGPVDLVLDNLRAWVQGGGVLLATDWSYDAVERAWPDRVDFFGDDAVPDAAQVGEPGSVAARVVDGATSIATGVDLVTVTYDLPVWPLIDAVSPDVQVYVSGDAPWRRGFQAGTSPDAPLLIGFDEGEGRVILSTWRPGANGAADALGVLSYLLAP
jgi:hypothetical protein